MKILLISIFLAISSVTMCIRTHANTRADGGCWKTSYGRGAGYVLNACRNGEEQNGALCYPKCQDGYGGAGPVCWQYCPSDFRDDGALCGKPAAYGRGTGYAIWSQGKCNSQNSQGCEKWGAMWYPKCRAGFYPFGCCVCSPQCPSGMTDMGVSCTKKSYGRGAGKPMICGPGLEQNAALCYNQCQSGYTGNGPVCWNQCPSGYKDCGALCLEPGKSCTTEILNMSLDAVQGVLEASAEFVSGNIVGGAISTATAVVELGSNLNYPLCSN